MTRALQDLAFSEYLYLYCVGHVVGYCSIFVRHDCVFIERDSCSPEVMGYQYVLHICIVRFDVCMHGTFFIR